MPKCNIEWKLGRETENCGVTTKRCRDEIPCVPLFLNFPVDKRQRGFTGPIIGRSNLDMSAPVPVALQAQDIGGRRTAAAAAALQEA